MFTAMHCTALRCTKLSHQNSCPRKPNYFLKVCPKCIPIKQTATATTGNARLRAQLGDTIFLVVAPGIAVIMDVVLAELHYGGKEVLRLFIKQKKISKQLALYKFNQSPDCRTVYSKIDEPPSISKLGIQLL